MKRLLLPLLCLGVAIAILISISDTRMSGTEISIMKNVLVNGMKECVLRDVDNKTTKFKDLQTFSDNYNYKFKIQAIDPNSCFKAKAIPENDTQTWYQIEINKETYKFNKTCGDSSKYGCNEGNTW